MSEPSKESKKKLLQLANRYEGNLCREKTSLIESKKASWWTVDDVAECQAFFNEVRRLIESRPKVDEEIEQLRVQLAGCLTAAEGWIENPAKQCDYGWSPAYAAVLNLRRKFEARVTVKEADDE